LQKPWKARNWQGFAKFLFLDPKDINDLRIAEICISKFSLGGIEEYQGVASKKIWKIEFLSGSPPGPAAKTVLRPPSAASFLLARRIDRADRMQRKSRNVQKMFL
jgi:hypothetical protein